MDITDYTDLDDIQTYLDNLEILRSISSHKDVINEVLRMSQQKKEDVIANARQALIKWVQEENIEDCT